MISTTVTKKDVIEYDFYRDRVTLGTWDITENAGIQRTKHQGHQDRIQLVYNSKNMERMVYIYIIIYIYYIYI